ncbi:glyoxylate/hydroxypyruvate reductase B isoform X3 [Polypterus senegalus]|uniref:glyoxylate/hydroxypyruvate reductase B isoform X3 n=1 Tax=Polypterus senegalus TaxID=55291 RepID=UPI001965E054|nr:glyoxylate/hydroxypyruvate reductase B isoform X3 [Polypterus senegalus]
MASTPPTWSSSVEAPGCREMYLGARENVKSTIDKSSMVLKNCARDLANCNVMEKPHILALKPGDKSGIHSAFAPIIEKHFTIISNDEFIKDKQRWADKVQAVFVWCAVPEVNRDLLQALPNLKAVINGGVGVDHLDIPLISSFGVKVTNTPNVVNNATADLGMTLLQASARKVIQEEEEKAVGAHYCETMDDLLRESDFVMLVVDLSPQTHRLIGKRELSLMKRTATLINISRGLVVDQDALVEALGTGLIHAAALDVTYPERLPRDHPLLKLDNVLIVPHMGTHTYQTTQALVERMVANALAILNGQPPLDEVKASK